jgi:hypothetical protein
MEWILKMMRTRLFGLLAVVATAGGMAAPAWAIPIYGSSDPANNSAELDFARINLLTLRVSLTNTSNYDARITGFGFDIVDGLALGLWSVSGTNDDGDWRFSFSGPGSLEAYAITGPNLWGGDPNSGIAVNLTGVFDFLGVFATDVSLRNVLVRWQRTGPDGEGSDKGYACTSSSPCTPTRIPEPSSLLLLGLGLLLGGTVRLRRRQVNRR